MAIHHPAPVAPLLRGVFLALTLAVLPARADSLPRPAGAAFAYGSLLTVAGYDAARPALEGFPVLVRISDNAPTGFFYDDLQSKSTGEDLAFVDMEGNGLPFEIDTWNPSGESLAWVRLPSMTNGTQFVMCWGSDASGKSLCADNPFSGYKGVWHMNSASPADASGSGNNGTAGGSAAVEPGKLGSAVSLPNKTDYVTCGQNLPNSDLFSGFTVEGWANLANTSGNHTLFGKNLFISVRTSGAKIQITTPGIKDHNDISAGLSAGTWFHWAMTFVPGNNGLEFYVNGANVNTQNASNLGNQTQSGEMWLGRNQWGNDQNFQGSLDEMRLSAGIKSADWIAADYATQNDPAFLTAGEAEPYGESADPVARVSVVSASYTNATVSAVVSGLGIGAASADVLVEIAASSDFGSPFWTTNYTVVAEDAQEFSVIGLATGTTYHVRATVENDAGADPVITRATTFATLVPGAPEGVAEFVERGYTTLVALGVPTSFGEGATSATIRLEASTNATFATVAAVSGEVSGTLREPSFLTVSDLTPGVEYHLRFRFVNDWGVESFVELEEAVVTLDGPVDASDIRWTFSADFTSVDVFLDVDRILDGATGTATLYCDEGDEPTTNRGVRTVSAPGTLEWAAIPFDGEALHAKVVLTSDVGGTVYTQSWTAVVDHSFKRLRPVKLDLQLEGDVVPEGASGHVQHPENAFDGNLATGVPARRHFSIVGCTTNRLKNTDRQEVYISRLEVTHKGDSNYSLYTSEDGSTWTLVEGATNVTYAGTASYSVSKVASFVKCTFESTYNESIDSLYEIEAWGYVKAKAQVVSNTSNASMCNADGSQMTANGQGGWNSNWGRLFDGNFTNYQMWPKAPTGGYALVDFTRNDGIHALKEYFVEELWVGADGTKKFTLQYSEDGTTWRDVEGAVAVTCDGIGKYTLGKVVKKVRYVFVDGSYNNFSDSYLAEFAVWGIDPNEAPCTHPSYTDWVLGAVPATCTERARDARMCTACGERFTRDSSGTALGHDYVTTLDRAGRVSTRKDFPDQRRFGEGSIACSRCDFHLDFPTALDLVTNKVGGTVIGGMKTEGIVRFTDVSVSSENNPQWGPGGKKIIDGVWNTSQEWPYWTSTSRNGQYADFEFGTTLDLTTVEFSVYNHAYDFELCSIDDNAGTETAFCSFSIAKDETDSDGKSETLETVNPSTGKQSEVEIWKKVDVANDYQRIRVPFVETPVRHLRIRIMDGQPIDLWGCTGIRVIEIHPWGTVCGAGDYAIDKRSIMSFR